MAQTTKDILKEALILEMKAKAFYTNVAETTKSVAAKNLFEMMAREESQHIDYLLDQLNNLKDNNTFVKPKDYNDTSTEELSNEVLTEQLKKEISGAGFEAAAISAAIDFETRTVEVYDKRAREAIDPNEKEFYRMMADWESEHQKDLHYISTELKEHVWNNNKFWSF